MQYFTQISNNLVIMQYFTQICNNKPDMHHPTDRTTHTTAFVTPVVEHWLKQEIAQWVHHEGLI